MSLVGQSGPNVGTNGPERSVSLAISVAPAAALSHHKNLPAVTVGRQRPPPQMCGLHATRPPSHAGAFSAKPPAHILALKLEDSVRLGGSGSGGKARSS
jgi:hypothetical protein